MDPEPVAIATLMDLGHFQESNIKVTEVSEKELANLQKLTTDIVTLPKTADDIASLN